MPYTMDNLGADMAWLKSRVQTLITRSEQQGSDLSSLRTTVASHTDTLEDLSDATKDAKQRDKVIDRTTKRILNGETRVSE